MESMAAFRPITIFPPPNPTTTPSSSLLSHHRYTHTHPHPLTTRCYPKSHLASSPESPKTPTAASGPVLGPGDSGSWDSHAVGSPVVKRFTGDDTDTWLMWYHGSPTAGAGDSIGLATSNNGVHWERSPDHVMQISTDWWAFDTRSIRPSAILVMSSENLRSPSAVYWMYYTGFSHQRIDIEIPNDENLLYKSLPGLAISQDGRHWARIEGEHHSGALFDSTGDWDSPFIAAPNVVYHSRGDLRMYYHSFDAKGGGGGYAIGIARSTDGIKWVKLGKVFEAGVLGSFDEAGARNANVVKSRNGYLMAYEGVAADGRLSIGLAVSPDGLKGWKRCGVEAALKPGTANDWWDSRGVGAPCLVQMDGGVGWRLYYRGCGDGGRTGIGLAVSPDPELTGFEKGMGFHLL